MNREGFARSFVIFLGVFLLAGACLTVAYLLLGGMPESGPVRGFLSVFCRLLVPAPLVAAAAAWIHVGISGQAFTLFTGRDGPPKAILDLSRIRSHIKKGEWDEARAELDRQWARYPGNGDLLREYERFFLDGLGAPIGAAKFFAAQVHAVTGEDRAYAYLRLAEFHADTFHQPQDAMHWCRRLLAEFPASPLASQTRILLDSLPPSPGK